MVFVPASVSFILASSLSPAFDRRLDTRGMLAAIALVRLGYLLMLLAAYTLVPLWGLPPLLVSLFVTGLGMSVAGHATDAQTLEAVAHDDIGAASDVYTTASQMAGALGVRFLPRSQPVAEARGGPCDRDAGDHRAQPGSLAHCAAFCQR
jgi:hypothetical protein